jgi:hypothetical protein
MRPYPGPSRYYGSLSKTKKAKRAAEIRKFGALGWKDPAAYVGFKTDKGIKTRKSGYTVAWYSRLDRKSVV